MSAQAEAKARQGYVDKLIPNTCTNCVFFSSTIQEENRWGQVWTTEKNLRCVKGGFAVKKMASCDDHVRKP